MKFAIFHANVKWFLNIFVHSKSYETVFDASICLEEDQFDIFNMTNTFN